MVLSHRLHLTLTFPRIVITTEEGWIVVVNSLKWSSLQHGQMRSPLSSRPLHKQVMQTNLLQMVNCTGLSSSLEHSWHSRSLVDTEALSDCVATHECEAGEQKKLEGAMDWMWSIAVLVLMVAGRPRFRFLFGRPPVLALSKCSQIAHWSGEWGLQVSNSTLGLYCFPLSTAFFDRISTL